MNPVTSGTGRSLRSLTTASGNSKEPEGFPVAWEIANAFSVAQSPIALLASRASGDCVDDANYSKAMDVTETGM